MRSCNVISLCFPLGKVNHYAIEVFFIYWCGWGLFSAEVLCIGSHLVLENTLDRCDRSLLVHGFVYNRFVYNIEHYCLYSVFLESSLFTCRATALMIQCCCIKRSAWGHVPPALSSMKHMQSPGEDWLHKNAFGVQISLHITQKYRALLQPLGALVWRRVTSLSSGARAGYDVDSPAWKLSGDYLAPKELISAGVPFPPFPLHHVPGAEVRWDGCSRHPAADLYFPLSPSLASACAFCLRNLSMENW